MRHIVVLGLVILAGCANPYAQFYHSTADPNMLARSMIVSSAPLAIYTTNDFAKDIDGLVRKGFFPIGNASFNAGSAAVSERQLRAQAAEVHAQVVLISSHYTHTVTGAIPLVLPNNSTSYSTGTATAYGAGGPVTAYGNATTTTYGTQTTMMPYSVARSDFGAVFFVKTRQRAGIIAVPLDDAARKRLGTNSGVLVRVVVDGTPAFNADVFAGDILLAVNAERVQSPEQYTQLLNLYEGQTTTFHFNRDGQSIEKTFRINSYQDPL